MGMPGPLRMPGPQERKDLLREAVAKVVELGLPLWLWRAEPEPGRASGLVAVIWRLALGKARGLFNNHLFRRP